MIDKEVQKLIDKGMSRRTAYRKVHNESKAEIPDDFDYDKSYSKGEWV